uniref:PiggyBac transposable element-derived protein 3 n=3 Tax=Bactrocera latifrons TaxID=174628 RepID=A0A0K8UM49_BACLA
MECMQSETVKYAINKGDEAFTVSLEELYTYFGILILSGYNKVPTTPMYWETESDVYNHLVAGSMARNKFEKIHRYLHFNDNTQIDSNNKAFKVQPVLDHLNTKFKELGKPFGTSFSVDESMEPYEFIRGKPIRYGYKIWCMTTSEGYLLNFDLYTGKNMIRSNEPLGLSVTKTLCYDIVPEHSTVFLDNYFNSFKLLEEFDKKNITVVGTIRSDRIENAPLSSMKRELRGTCEALKSKNITLVRWNDNNNVTIATNCKNDNITTTTGLCKRYDRQQKRRQDVKQPVIIKEYNSGMGGVDLFDQQRTAYRTRIRSRKWYWAIFRFCLNGAVVNLWILFRKAYPQVTLLGLIRRLTRSIFSKAIDFHPVSSRKRKRENETRYDGVEHYVNYSKTQRRCKNFGKCTKFICMKYNFGLHPDNCFYKYHVN